MDRLIYNSLAALRAAQARQIATANNLANAATPGFRADLSEAQTIWLSGVGFESRASVAQEVKAADMRAGVVTETGRPLDIVLEGDALLAVQAPNGEEAYTRRGDLQLTETGLLTTGDGLPVLGLQGPVTVPPADRITIGADGRISIVPAGGNPGQPQDIGQIKLTSAAGIGVRKGSDGLFRSALGAALPADPDAHLRTGHLEGSNVSTTQALVDMVDASRAWDVQLKLLGEARDNDAATTQLMNLNN